MALVLLVLAVSWTHWPVLSAQALCLDDGEFLKDNPLVQNPGWNSAKRFFGEVFEPTSVGGYYLPLSMVSLMGDYAMGGRPDDLFAFHRTNLVLHVANTLLVFAVLYLLFGNVLASVMVALLFGLHPLTVEPVAWIGERKTLLAGFFSFLSILAYVRSAKRNAIGWLIASVAAYVLALLSKPTAVPLPLLLMAIDYWPIRRWDRRTIVGKWPYFALALAFGVITIVSHGRTAGISESHFSDLVRLPLRLGHLIAFYLGKVIWPVNLSSVYPAPDPMSLGNPTIMVSVLVVVALAIVVAYSLKRTRALFAASIFFLLGIAPTLGVVRYSWVYASDKYVYLPMLGFLLLVAALFRPAMRRAAHRRLVIIVPVLGVCAAEAVATRSYLRKWRDTQTLSKYILTQAPDNAQIRINLAAAYEEQRRISDAIDQYQQAIRIDPDYALAHSNLGSALIKAGRTQEAITHIRRALEIKPGFAQGHNNLAVALLSLGRIDEAKHHCLESIRLKPGYPRPLFNLANVHAARGRISDAIQLYRQAVEIDARYVEAYRSLGRLLLSEGSPDEAVDCYLKVLEISAAAAEDHFGLAMSLFQMHKTTKALESFEQAMRMAPQWAAPINGAAWILATDPDQLAPDRALELATRAAQLTDHRDPDILDTLAAARAAAGDFDGAMTTLREAIRLAIAQGRESNLTDMRQRLTMYELSQPYVEKRQVE